MPQPDPSPAAPPLPGYTLTALIGRGASGEVWRAVPRAGGEPVAVKLLVDGDAESQAREAALLGALDHPHLVRLHEVVHQPRRGGPPRVALVLDLLAGGSLADLLARRGRLRPGEVVTAVAPVAAALAHVHGEGVIHGDLSPANVVFTAEGRPVLTDLGVARVVGEAVRGRVTPAYVDPVVARGGAPGPSSDVFGLAAAAFHALTGVAPWNGAAPGDVLDVAASGELPDLAELAPEAPAELRAVVARGLAADPHQRGSAAAFALDLRHACRPEPVRLAAAGDLAGEPFPGQAAELTHQVPGRHRRPEPRIVVPPTGPRALLGGLRRAALPAVAVVLVAAAVWAGGTALRAAERGAEASTPVPAAAGSGRSTASSAAPAEPTPPPAPPPAADPDPDWSAVVSRLYAERAAALSAGAPDDLGRVYAEGSALLAADRAWLDELRSTRTALQGFAPAVVEVRSARVSEERVHLHLVDRWPDYELTGDGALRTVPGRGEQAVQMVLLRAADGWRIESARRVG
jgi:eukaryotic-like serine/threonine-protein kinase